MNNEWIHFPPIGLEQFASREDIVEAVCRCLMLGWKHVSDEGRVELGFDPERAELIEEEGLTYLACIFIDCANATLDQARAAKVRRLRASDVVGLVGRVEAGEAGERGDPQRQV